MTNQQSDYRWWIKQLKNCKTVSDIRKLELLMGYHPLTKEDLQNIYEVLMPLKKELRSKK